MNKEILGKVKVEIRKDNNVIPISTQEDLVGYHFVERGVKTKPDYLARVTHSETQIMVTCDCSEEFEQNKKMCIEALDFLIPEVKKTRDKMLFESAMQEIKYLCKNGNIELTPKDL